jgi:hypothetical protein
MDIPLPGEIPLPGDPIPLPASPPPLPGPDTEFSAVSTRGFSVGFPFANPAKQQQPLPPAFPPPSDDVDVLFQPPTHKETAVAAAAALYSPSRVRTTSLRILDILVRIRIRGSMPLTMDPDPAIFVLDLQDTNKKTNFKRKFFCLLLIDGTFTSFFKDKKSKRSQKTGIKVFLYYFIFCLKIEGYGSVPLANGSGSRGAKNKDPTDPDPGGPKT